MISRNISRNGFVCTAHARNFHVFISNFSSYDKICIQPAPSLTNCRLPPSQTLRSNSCSLNRSFITSFGPRNNSPVVLSPGGSTNFASNAALQDDSSYSATSNDRIKHDLVRTALNASPVDWNALVDCLRQLRVDKSYSDVLDMAHTILSILKSSPESRSPPSQLFEELLLTIYESITVTTTPTTPTASSRSPSTTDLLYKSPDHANLFALLLHQMIVYKCEIPFIYLSMFYQLIVPLGDAFFTQTYIQISSAVAITTTAQKKRHMNNIIRLYISCQNMEAALESLHEMADANAGQLSLKRSLYEVLLLATLHENDLEYSRQVVEYLHNSGGPVYARTWGIFMSHACRLMDYNNVEWAWKTAVIPGRVILDDWCYRKMADIGRLNGDFALTRWAILREQRRKQALGKPDETNPIHQFSALIDAYSRNENKYESIIACLKFIKRIGDRGCKFLTLRDFPQLAKVISSDEELLTAVLEYIKPRLEGKTKTKAPPYPQTVKTVYFNILLSSFVHANFDVKLILDLYRKGPFEYNIKYNEDTMLSILQLAKTKQDILLIRQTILYDCEAFNVRRTRRMFELAINLCRDLAANDAADEYINLMKAAGINPKQYLTHVHITN